MAGSSIDDNRPRRHRSHPVSVEATVPYKNPFLWVPTSYLTMGLIYVTVGSVANIMFKNMGMPNDQAAFWSSLLGFPTRSSSLWAPLLELYKTKKFFVVLMQFVIARRWSAPAPSRSSCPGRPGWPPPSFLLAHHGAGRARRRTSAPTASTSRRWRPKDQAKYTGFQSMCWNLGRLLATGPVRQAVSGMLHDQTGSWATAWMVVMLVHRRLHLPDGPLSRQGACRRAPRRSTPPGASATR